jgi:hypothetical protein
MIEPRDTQLLTDSELNQILENGHRLLLLWRACPERHFFRAWQRFGLGCVTRAYHSLRRILELNDGGPDSVTLARSLFDHVVALAWMAEDPETRFEMIRRRGLANAGTMASELRRFGDEAMNVDLELLQREGGGSSVPGTQEQARIAEIYWSAKMPAWEWGFSHQYSGLFRPYCWCVHPTDLGVGAFFDTEGRLIFDPPDAGFGHVRAQSVASFADALVIASALFEWPSFEDVANAYTNNMVE